MSGGACSKIHELSEMIMLFVCEKRLLHARAKARCVRNPVTSCKGNDEPNASRA
jgi:hypothetical protein